MFFFLKLRFFFRFNKITKPWNLSSGHWSLHCHREFVPWQHQQHLTWTHPFKIKLVPWCLLFLVFCMPFLVDNGPPSEWPSVLPLKWLNLKSCSNCSSAAYVPVWHKNNHVWSQIMHMVPNIFCSHVKLVTSVRKICKVQVQDTWPWWNDTTSHNYHCLVWKYISQIIVAWHYNTCMFTEKVSADFLLHYLRFIRF